MTAMIVGDNKVADQLKSLGRQFAGLRVLFLAVVEPDSLSIAHGFEDLGFKVDARQISSVDEIEETLERYSPEVIIVDNDKRGCSIYDLVPILEKNGVNPLCIITVDSVSGRAVAYGTSEDERIRLFRAGIGRISARVAPLLLDKRRVGLTERVEAKTHSSAGHEQVYLGRESSSGTGFVVIEPRSNRTLYLNEAFARMTGYSAREVLQMKSFSALIAQDAKDAFKKGLREVGKKGTSTNRFPAKIIRRDGERTELKFAATQFSWNNRKRIAMIIYDSTAATAGTSDKEAGIVRSAAFDHHSPFGSFDWNAGEFVVIDIDKQGRVKNWSPSAERLTGYRDREIVGAKFDSLLASEDDETKSQARSFFDGRLPAERIELESQVSQRTGDKIWAGITLTRLFDAMGVASGFSLVIRPLAELAVPEAQLREREAQLHSLTSHLQMVREEERTNIARQLHDEFGQMLTAVRIDLSILGRMISRTVSEPLGRVSLLERVSSISEILERSIKSARKMITELRPPILDELGLLTAIQWQVLEFENRTGIQCHIKNLQHGVTFEPAVSTAVFRILQQALDNVMRHSAATQVSISLRVVEPNIVLKVSDNGKGIEAEKLKDPSSTGLIGMRERVLAFGGNLEVHGQQGKGTTLTVSIPSAKKQRED